jgi:hypothetical protein
MDEELIPTAPPALEVPQELILAIAMGMEDPKEVASRYGYEGLKWEMLNGWKPFGDAVASKRAELETSGITFKIKAKALTEDVFEDAYKIARSNDATLLQKLEFVKLGAKLGDMEPKTRPRVAVEVPGIARMAKANATLVNCDPKTEMVRAKNSRRKRGLVPRERSATRTGCLEAVISKWLVG